MHKCAYTEYMGVEWDPDKAKANLAKHGVRFADAATALEDELALTIRDPLSENEERWITLGRDVLRRILVVTYTWRRDDVRIISARPAMAQEIRQYEEDYET